MVIPRENKLVRLYIQLTEVAPDASGRADRSKINPETIIKAAQKILSPWTLTYQYCDWWTAYQIGQRVGNQWGRDERIFLAGDAVHTHSPKAGQGMNVSMQDTFNLGWKLGLVIKGMMPRSFLKTYEFERKRNAHDLIEFDHRLSRLYSEKNVPIAEFKEAFMKGQMFATGTTVDYNGSPLVAKAEPAHSVNGVNGATNGVSKPAPTAKQELAPGVSLGKRMPSHKVLNQSDARPWHLAEFLKADGRFRVIIFAGDVTKSEQKKRLENFVDGLEAPLKRVTPADAPVHSVIDVLTVHAAPRASVDIFTFPELLRPFDDQTGWDYDSILVDDASFHEGHGEIYKNLGIDRQRGCVVITRPDQHVAYIGDLEEGEDVSRYFEAALQPVSMHRDDAVKRRQRIPIVDGDSKGGVSELYKMAKPLTEVTGVAL